MINTTKDKTLSHEVVKSIGYSSKHARIINFSLERGKNELTKSYRHDQGF